MTESSGFVGSPHGWAARTLYSAAATTMDWVYDHGICARTPEVYGARSVVVAERMNPGDSFCVGMSIGVEFDPDPSEILLTAERRNRFNLNVLASSHNTGVTVLFADDGLLTLTLANDGSIPVEIHATTMGEGGFTNSGTTQYLQASRRSLSLACPRRPDVQSPVITMIGHNVVGTLTDVRNLP